MAGKNMQSVPKQITHDEYKQAIETIAFWDQNKKINKMEIEEIAELNEKLDKCWATKRKYNLQNSPYNK